MLASESSRPHRTFCRKKIMQSPLGVLFVGVLHLISPCALSSNTFDIKCILSTFIIVLGSSIAGGEIPCCAGLSLKLSLSSPSTFFLKMPSLKNFDGCPAHFGSGNSMA